MCSLLNVSVTGIGRSMKVGKEEIVGALVALQQYTSADHAAETLRWQHDIHLIAHAVADIAGTALRIVDDLDGPILFVDVNSSVLGRTAKAIAQELLAGRPRIFVSPTFNAEDTSFEIGATMLQPGEAEIVAQRVRDVLCHSSADVDNL